MLRTTGLEVGRPVRKLSNSVCRSVTLQEIELIEMVLMATLKKGLRSEVWVGLGEQMRRGGPPTLTTVGSSIHWD